MGRALTAKPRLWMFLGEWVCASIEPASEAVFYAMARDPVDAYRQWRWKL